MPPASETIRERILADVVTALQLPDGGADYWYSIGSNQVVRFDVTPMSMLPALLLEVGGLESRRVDASQAGNEAYADEELDVIVTGYLGERGDIETKLSRLEHDIRSALYVDRTRNSLARNTEWQQTEYIYPGNAEERAMIIVRFSIVFEIKESDLTATIP